MDAGSFYFVYYYLIMFFKIFKYETRYIVTHGGGGLRYMCMSGPCTPTTGQPRRRNEQHSAIKVEYSVFTRTATYIMHFSDNDDNR